MTAQFADLPIEVLPIILQNIPRIQDLSACSLVSKAFHELGVPVLYRWVYIHSWRRDGKEKVRGLGPLTAETET